MGIKFLTTLLLISIAISAFSQNSGEIVGKVIDSISQEPLSFANVSLEQNGVSIIQMSCDEFGKFVFKPVDPGVYEIKITYVGYPMKTFTNVKIRPNEMHYAEYSLNGENMKNIVEIFPDDIVIDPLIGDDIDEKEIRKLPPISPQEIVVQRRSDIYSPDGGESGGLYIQGSRADATLFVIDGIRVDGSAYVPKNAIRNITVYAGGIPAKYGDVTGGVIEITTKSYTGIY
jgi:hypothetical protein